MKLVVSGAGAAALACLDLLVALGLPMENIWVTDIKGVVYEGRKEEMDANKARYARKTDARTLGDVIDGADIFLGLSAGGVLKPEMVKKMAAQAADPRARQPRCRRSCRTRSKAVRPDAIIATGRSDYPNQVNNVLCFPFIFRGALDVGATTINEEMKLAAVQRHRRARAGRAVRRRGRGLRRRSNLQLRPRVPDPEALRSAPDRRRSRRRWPRRRWTRGVATRPIADFDAYREQLNAVRLPLRPAS